VLLSNMAMSFGGCSGVVGPTPLKAPGGPAVGTFNRD
jgi:hypothetical protein